MKLLQRLSIGLTYVGGFSIVFTVLVVISDIIGRTVFNFSLMGAYDLVTTALVVSVYAGMSEAFRQQAHITVDLIDNIGNVILSKLFALIALVAALAMIGLLVWLSAGQAFDAYRFRDVTADLRIPKVWHWSAIIIGLSVTCVTLVELIAGSVATLTRPEPLPRVGNEEVF